MSDSYSGFDFYSTHKEEIIGNMITSLEKMRKGSKTSTAELFHRLYPEVMLNCGNDDFLMQLHADLCDAAKRAQLWLDFGKEKHQISGMPYHITYAVRRIHEIS